MHEFDKCIVVSKSGSQLAEGFVVEFDKEKLKICSNNEYSFAVPQEVTIFIYNEVKGECLYTGTAQSIYDKKIAVEKVKFVNSRQKRDNTRVSKIMHYRITHKLNNKEKEALEKPIDIIIHNISAQGMYISCDEKFSVGYRFPFVFKDAGRPMNLIAEIVRHDSNNRANNYGCRFVDISEKDMDNIFRFVLHEQIEQRRRETLR